MAERASRALVLIPAGPDWRDRAACTGHSRDAFYPNDSDHAGIVRAKRICRTCPVVAECLDFALASREPWGVWGVWGGMTPDERRAHTRNQPIAPRGRATRPGARQP